MLARSPFLGSCRLAVSSLVLAEGGRPLALAAARWAFYAGNIAVHCGQRRAPIGIALVHSGQGLVSAAAGGGGGNSRFTCFTIINMTSAMIRNSIIVLM